MMELLHKEITDKILRAFYNVYNELGFGFLEKVYENAMLIELQKNGLVCFKQQSIRVYYHDCVVGDYYADIIVGNDIILELKAAEAIAEEHELQLINYLKATDMEVGLLLNLVKSPNSKERFLRTIEKQSVKICSIRVIRVPF